MKNRIAASPLALTSVNLWSEIPDAPPRAMAAVGPRGQLTRLRKMWLAAAERDGGDFDLALFLPDMKRRATPLRTYVASQVPSLDATRGAIVLAGNGERLYALAADGSARCLGVHAGGGRFRQAAWLPFGFAALDRDDVLHVYRAREGSAPEPLARYQLEARCDGVGVVAPGVLAVGAEDGRLLHFADDGSCRVLGSFDADIFVAYECVDETGRCMALLPERHVSFGGEHFRIEQLDEAVAARDSLPQLESLGAAAELERGADLAAPAEPDAAPKNPAPVAAPREPDVAALPRYSRALVRKILESPRRAAPLGSVLALLAYPMPAALYAYVWARAVHAAASATVYEAWLDRPPVEAASARARRIAGAGVGIELGTLANGDAVIAVLAGTSARVYELSHEEDSERRFESFEGFLADVCARADEAGVAHGLEAYLS